MKLNTAIVTGEARAAATVILLRDGAAGLEVFLLKRHDKSNAFAGAFVFPGGKVDAADSELDMASHLDQTPAMLYATLGEPNLNALTAAGIYVAALREVFEECGILFVEEADKALLASAAGSLREGESFNAMLRTWNLRLQTSSLAPWSRWITPVMPSMSSKRFDTRFFVAALPAGQTALHDNYEATGSVWLAPRAALEQYESGSIMLAPPQIMTLAHLSRYRSVNDALKEARSRQPATIQPEPYEHSQGRIVCYPGDELHPVKERAMPGPTRLHYREKKFLPLGGFESLFD